MSMTDFERVERFGAPVDSLTVDQLLFTMHFLSRQGA